MFRDRDEELKRLQDELLEEEEQEAAEEFLDAEAMDSLLEGDEQGQSPEVYQNYSNDYGKKLRNFASGYRAYNADRVDEDLDSFSQAVQEPPQKKRRGCVALILLLLAAAAVALLWLLARKEGLV